MILDSLNIYAGVPRDFDISIRSLRVYTLICLSDLEKF